jgi:hypothetical protein
MFHLSASTLRKHVLINTNEERTEFWHVKAKKKLWSYIHYKFPNAIPSPYMQESDRAYIENRDREKNISTKVSEQEEVRLSTIWGSELYGPSEIDQLYLNLHKLGWDVDRIARPGSGALDWIKEQRMYGSKGNFNIGIVRRQDEVRFLHQDYFASLPNEIDYLIVQIHQLTASLTCVLINFVIKEKYTKDYETELKADRKTINERIKGKSGYQILGVAQLKRNSIDRIRNKYRDIVVCWFHKNLPGFFCLSADGNRLPTAEMITTKSELILKNRNETDHPRPESLNFLVPFNYLDIWINTNYPGLRLSMDGLSGDTRFHTIISLKTSAIKDEDIKIYGERTPQTLIALCQEHLNEILCSYAALALLQEARRTLKLSRESLSLSNGSYSQVLKNLKNITSFFDKSLGIPTIVDELRKKSEKNNFCNWSESDFLGPREMENSEPNKITEVLRIRTEYLATTVLMEENATREHFLQIASIMSTRESVKTQKRMEILTIITAIIATASLIAALQSIQTEIIWEQWYKSISSTLSTIVASAK